MNEQQKRDPKFAKFHGVNREQIQWNPVIDESKCIGCGMCVTTCGRGVYKFDYENMKSKVANPNNCVVGCTGCDNICPQKAITHPPKSYLDNLTKNAKSICSCGGSCGRKCKCK